MSKLKIYSQLPKPCVQFIKYNKINDHKRRARDRSSFLHHNAFIFIAFDSCSSFLVPLMLPKVLRRTPIQSHKNIHENMCSTIRNIDMLWTQESPYPSGRVPKINAAPGPFLSLQSIQGGNLKQKWASRWGRVNKLTNQWNKQYVSIFDYVYKTNVILRFWSHLDATNYKSINITLDVCTFATFNKKNIAKTLVLPSL